MFNKQLSEIKNTVLEGQEQAFFADYDGTLIAGDSIDGYPGHYCGFAQHLIEEGCYLRYRGPGGHQEFLDVYSQMHSLGLAHSVEVWYQQNLVGGTYGVCLGGAFFAESKFHRKTDASKVALYYLVEHMKEKGLTLLECQFLTPHLKSLGAIEVSDHEYLDLLKEALKQEVSFI